MQKTKNLFIFHTFIGRKDKKEGDRGYRNYRSYRRHRIYGRYYMIFLKEWWEITKFNTFMVVVRPKHLNFAA